MNVDLKTLGLEKQWPKLAKLQREIAGLERQVSDAERQVTMMRNALGPAKEKDLNTAAAAIRSGKDVPHGTNEDAAKRQLEAAERTHAIMQRAAQDAREDFGNYLAKHQAALYADVAGARNKLAEEVATAARAASASFGKWYELQYTLKNLAPPPEPMDPNQPAQRLTTVFAGVQTTRSAGPDRGAVESMLSYLISLGTGPTEGADNAA